MKSLRQSSGPGFPVSFRHFNCTQCGKCCTLSVEPTEDDIKRIEMLGHRRLNFMRNGMLRKVKGRCMFLEKRDGRAFCRIHEMKPKVCRDYPYTAMRRNWLFSCPGLDTK